MHRRLAMILSLAFCLSLAASSARSEHCADSADRPAVCTVEAYGGLQGERLRAFNLNGTALLEPNQVLEIELDAFDQNRRRFPKDRLAFEADANDCRDLAKVEQTDVGRFRISTGIARDQCEIWFWLPGNLNHEWKLDLQVESRARTGYDSTEAQFITRRLYLALLGREPDPQGERDTSAAVLRGNLDGRIDEMLRSEEFRARSRGADAAWTLEQLYMGIFDRKPDASATQAFTHMIQRGQVGEVLRELVESDEFEQILGRH